MEVPELNEDMLDGESNNELINQTEDSTSLDESSIQNEDKIPMEVDSAHSKSQGVEVEAKVKESEQNEGSSSDNDLHKQSDDSQTSLLQENSLSKNLNESEQIEEPAKKKLKLDEGDRVVPSVTEEDIQSQQEEPDPELLQQPQPESEQQQSDLDPDTEQENESQLHSEDSQQFEGSEQQELMDGRKDDEKVEMNANKESGKPATGPDTDMLATLASAALEQDPKDKTQQGTPKLTAVKSENEVPKKKPEMWCNVGVFDTNTTIVSDYVATPEPNEHVDLVTATLGGRRIQLEPGTAYKFRVCAVNGCGTGPWSDVAAFKTTLPGFPGAPSAIKISKSPEGAHLTWEPPGGNSSEILEYAVYLAVRSASQGCQPVTTNQAQLAFVRVFCGPTNKCMVGTNSLQAAHIDTTTKPAIIFRIAARNSKGYGPATQVRWLQESQNGGASGVKRAVKS